MQRNGVISFIDSLVYAVVWHQYFTRYR